MCKHENMRIHANFMKHLDGHLSTDIQIWCGDCHKFFEFERPVQLADRRRELRARVRPAS